MLKKRCRTRTCKRPARSLRHSIRMTRTSRGHRNLYDMRCRILRYCQSRAGQTRYFWKVLQKPNGFFEERRPDDSITDLSERTWTSFAKRIIPSAVAFLNV